MFTPSMNALGTEHIGLRGVINPVSQGVGSVSTGWIAAADYANFVAALQVGALGASATVDAKLEQAQNGSGTGAKDITGKAITQLTKASTDDNKQAFINLKPEELDIANNFTHFRLTVTVATAACLISAQVLGLTRRYGFASDGNVATVDSIVS